MSTDESSVRVAVRIRPQLPREILDMSRICTNVTPGEPQITLGNDKAFTYDYVFDTDSKQNSIYDTCAKSLVKGSLEGYNATILAYGQTGSGKTYTMGTGFDVDVNSHLVGIIPRAIHELFNGINRITEEFTERGQPPPKFKVTAQFLELYNDEIMDLLEYSKDKKTIKISGDSNRSVYLTGVKSEKVSSPGEALKWLKEGALARTTASTCMNAQSSRSHAIFTLHIWQQRVVSAEAGEGESVENDMETLSAKFHFVDLAGSERLKRTGATGDRAKEGISINCGLLALGNVISALGDQSKRALHVPYRDSKLTRLLQDSLGGNSRTLMIACVSPSDADFMETLNTLNYANRARNIQNKVVINQDKTSRTISMLKKQIQELQLELMEYKQGKRVIGDDGVEAVNDMFHENTLLQTELDSLRTRVKALQQTVDSLNARNIELLSDKAITCINQDGDNKNDDMSQLIKGYLTEIETLRAKLVESESICSELRKTVSRNRAIAHHSIDGDENVQNVIELANKAIEREISLVSTKKKSKDQSDDSEGDSCSESEGEGDDSEENGKNEYSAELAALTSEISIKQQLIEALEKSQKKLHNMKSHYEEKLVLLQEKIQATVKERDSVLAAYCKENNQPTEKINKVKEDYEKRLSVMQRELKSLQTAKKEHARLLRNQSQNESHIRVLSNEVAEMKRTKVKLMNKMKEETQRHKEAENRRNREIAQLKKKTRIDANTIKKMEEEKRAKMIVLKRKQEEVSALRLAANRNSSHKKSGRTGIGLNEAKRKWVLLEKRIAEITLNNQSISALEREMVKKMERRGEILDELKQKKIAVKDPSCKDSHLLKEEVENLQANLDHIQSAVSDLQNEILQVSENKEAFGSDILNTVTNPTEFPFIIEKLYNMALHHSCLAAQSEYSFKELAMENEQLKKDSEMQEQLLRHLVENQNKENRLVSPNCESSPEPSPRSASPLDNGNESLIPRRIFGKQRKKMMAPQDLLFQNDNPSHSSTVGMTMSYHGGQSLSAATSPEHHRPASDNNHAPFPLTRSLTTIKVQSVPASPVSLRKGLTLSPRINRKTYIITSNHPSMEKGLDASPPGSPQPYRRQTSREENVFSRLTSQQPNLISTSRKPGKITVCPPKKMKQALQCSHVIEGHSRAVLTLHATADNLFTGSKDRTVIVWDLNEMREAQVFGQHKDSVVDIKYNHALQLLFTVYSCYVEMRDLRAAKPVQLLNFDGLVFPPSSQLYNYERYSSPINSIAINDSGTYLYSAVDRVRAWDLRILKTVTKLVGHQSKVKCVAVTSQPDNSDDTVVTGGKDHYIKVFDMGGQLNGFHFPRATLDPPHYDGIECLAVQNQTLFSGSRDCHIKKWKLDASEHVMSINLAHRDWVTDLCFSPDGSMLVSGSRDGFLKLWSVDTCTNLGQVQTNDSPINALASNSSHIFSASGDAKCHLWKISSQLAV